MRRSADVMVILLWCYIRMFVLYLDALLERDCRLRILFSLLQLMLFYYLRCSYPLCPITISFLFPYRPGCCVYLHPLVLLKVMARAPTVLYADAIDWQPNANASRGKWWKWLRWWFWILADFGRIFCPILSQLTFLDSFFRNLTATHAQRRALAMSVGLHRLCIWHLVLYGTIDTKLAKMYYHSSEGGLSSATSPQRRRHTERYNM